MLFIHLIEALKRIGKPKYTDFLAMLNQYHSEDAYSNQSIIRSVATEKIGEIPVKIVLQYFGEL